MSRRNSFSHHTMAVRMCDKGHVHISQNSPFEAAAIASHEVMRTYLAVMAHPEVPPPWDELLSEDQAAHEAMVGMIYQEGESAVRELAQRWGIESTIVSAVVASVFLRLRVSVPQSAPDKPGLALIRS